MIQIRKNVFETNSSSLHSICITKNSVDPDSLPDKISFKHGEFGWQWKKYDKPEEKASYLYEAICFFYDGRERNEVINRIYDMLLHNGINSDFESDKKELKRINKFFYGYAENYGYIDHPSGLKNFVESMLRSEKRLMKYLFSEESFILTGNDNSDREWPVVKVKYKHETYEKGQD